MRLKIISIIALITISLSVNAQPQTPTEENEAASKTLFELSPFERAVCCIRFYEGLHRKKDYPYVGYGHKLRKHTIFRHDNFIGCFSADKIKMSARKYFCFNIPVYKNMAEESSCRRPYHEEYIQTSASGNLEGLYRSTYSFLSARR